MPALRAKISQRPIKIFQCNFKLSVSYCDINELEFLFCFFLIIIWKPQYILGQEFTGTLLKLCSVYIIAYY